MADDTLTKAAAVWQQNLTLVLLGGALVFVSGFAASVASVPTVDQFVLAVLCAGAISVAAIWTVFRATKTDAAALGAQAPPSDTFAGLGLSSTLLIVLAVAMLMRVIGFATPHDGLTTDAYRYVWDGRIQWAGVSPYAHVPAADELADLRDAEVYPNINQKTQAVTIYPPFAQVLFAVGNKIADSVTGIKALMKIADLVVLFGLLALLHAMGLPRERIIIYAWHPLPVWEFVSQAHIDAAATALIVLTLIAVWRMRPGLAGGLLAAAVLTKYFPLVILPAIWRRWDWRMPLGFAVVSALLILPYWLAGQPNLAGYLGQHLDNEGYRAGWGFHGIWMLRDFAAADPPSVVWIGSSAVVLAIMAGLIFFKRGPDPFKPRHLVLLAASFVWLTSPHYPWYFVWLVPLLCLHLSPAVLLMTLAAPVLYWPRPPDGATWTEIYAVVYYLPLFALMAELLWSRRKTVDQNVPSQSV